MGINMPARATAHTGSPFSGLRVTMRSRASANGLCYASIGSSAEATQPSSQNPGSEEQLRLGMGSLASKDMTFKNSVPKDACVSSCQDNGEFFLLS